MRMAQTQEPESYRRAPEGSNAAGGRCLAFRGDVNASSKYTIAAQLDAILEQRPAKSSQGRGSREMLSPWASEGYAGATVVLPLRYTACRMRTLRESAATTFPYQWRNGWWRSSSPGNLEHPNYTHGCTRGDYRKDDPK